MFYKTTQKGLTIILVYVDDCMIAATSIILVNWIKQEVREFVEIMDLGEIHWLLGIEVKQDHKRRRIMLFQRSYINISLCHYGLENLKLVSIPIDSAVCLL